MALINRAGQEISAKVVYYGPGLSGKTTNLEVLFRQVPEDNRGKMISMKTRTDRTLFFDLLPLSGDAILDFNVRILLYTVPGQVYYNATRRLVLKGVDAVVFVADSQRGKMEENLESLENLRSNLVDMGLKLEDLPWVIQYNKRDLPDILSVEELEQALNPTGVPSFTAVAPRGEGVQETLRGVTEHLRPQLQRMVEKELGDTLRSGHGAAPSPMQSTPPRSVQQSTPPAPVPPPAPAAPDGGARHTLDLGGLPDPRVVEMAPGTHPKPQSPAAGGIADLMDGRDMRRALREVETSVEASPLRSLSETPAPSTHNAQSPLERMTASTPTAKTPSHVVPEIVEIQEMPTPTPPVTQTPYTAAPVNAAPPVAPPPAPPAPEPPQAVAPPAPTPVAPPATPPAAVTDSAPQVLTLRVPRSLLIRGEITLRLVLDDSPSATGGGQSGAASSAATPAAPAAPAAPAPTAAPVGSAEPVTAAPPPPPPAPAPAPAPEPVPVPAAAPAHARSSAPMAGRPAGTGTRFALRDGELVPLD